MKIFWRRERDMKPLPAYIDFLGLLDRSFENSRWIAFCGRSGSGKSTAIQFLLECHSRWHGVVPFRIHPYVTGWEEPCEGEWVVVDEVRALRDIPRLFSLIRSGRRVLIASHIPSLLMAILSIQAPGAIFSTDRGGEKLALHLERRGIAFTEESLANYLSRYGSTFTDLEIILERTGKRDLSSALRRFHGLNRII
jgi:hypothetical protein